MKKKSIKQQILDITGMSEEEFYKTYPHESDIPKLIDKYGAKVEKLLNGGSVKKAQTGWQNNFAPAPFQMQTYDVTGGQGNVMQAATNSINANIIQNRRNNLRQGVGLDSDEGVMDESVQKPNFIQGLRDDVSKMDSDDVQLGFQAASSIGGSIQRYAAARAAKKAAKDQNKLLTELSPLITQANSSMPERARRNYLRPDDPEFLIQPDTFHNPKGVGTNILAAKKGAEIANTFAPNTIYTDLEQMQDGGSAGLIPEAINTVGDMAAWFGGMNTRKLQRENEKLMGQMGMQPGIQNINSQYVSHMEDGGFVNPQIAKSLEGIPMKRLFAPDPTMDTLRAGGHLKSYTSPSERAMYTGREQFAMGGNLRTHWGGGLKDLSYNPFGGPTVKAVGNSHDESDEYGRTGIGLSVGDTGNSLLQDYAEFGTKVATDKAVVEVEPEPIIMRENPDGSESAVVFGALKFPKFIAKAMDKSEWSNKSFKKIVENDIVKKENKLSKQQSKALQLLESDDLLKKKTGEVTMIGVKDGFKAALDDKNFLADFQDVMNKADEAGFDIHKFEKTGQLTKAKMGAKITTAQKGITKEQQTEAEKLYKSGNVKAFQEYVQKIAPDVVKQIIDEKGLPRAGVFADNLSGPRTNDAYQRIMDPGLIGSTSQSSGRSSRTSIADIQSQIASQMNALEPMYTEQYTGSVPEIKSKTDWFDLGRDVFNQVRPFILPSNAEGLSPEQISGELAALATNQLRPVHMQKAPLRLRIAQDISLQDQLAQNQSNYRAAIRNLGNNPTAISMLNAQKYQADQQVLANQFRANQENEQNTYGYNLDAMNKNDLMNLQLMDQQYVRQEQALSNTKAVQQAALNSINAKILENRNLNKALQTYENLYNFRFDKKGRAYNVNPLAEFNLQGSGAATTPFAGMDPDELELYAKQLKIQQKKQEQASKNSTSKRNGGIVQAMKGLSLKDYK
jgi:hypothetical protein